MSEISRHEASPVFLEKSEILLSSLTRGIISHLLLGGNLRSRFILLTDRRVYYSGKQLKGGDLGAAQIIIPLDAISSISIFQKKAPGIALLGIVFLVLGIIIGLVAKSMMAVVLSAFFFLFMLFAYGASTHIVCTIASSSVKIEIDFQFYGEEQTRRFIRDLGAAMDHLRGFRQLRAEASGQNNERIQHAPEAKRGDASEEEFRVVTGIVRRKKEGPASKLLDLKSLSPEVAGQSWGCPKCGHSSANTSYSCEECGYSLV